VTDNDTKRMKRRLEGVSFR